MSTAQPPPRGPAPKKWDDELPPARSLRRAHPEMSLLTFQRVVSQFCDLTGAGCCLHLVVDDLNVDDSSVRHCLEQARAEGHALCFELAEAFSEMTEQERELVLKIDTKEQTL